MRKGTTLILLGAAAFAALVFVLLMHTEPVKVVQSRLVHQGNEVFVAGELRNNSANSTGPFDLEIHYYDRAGRPLGEDTVQVGPLRAGAAERFRGPAHAPDAVADFSLYLNHGRNPYGN
jgi:hypothetical protein